MKGRFSMLSNIEVQKWLKEKRFENHREFINCNGIRLLKHPRRSLLDKCGVADGIRLYNLLRPFRSRENDTERIITPRKNYRGHLISCNYDDDDDYNDSDSETTSTDDEEDMIIDSPHVNITRDHLNVEHIRTVLADVTRSSESEIGRIFVEKVVENGKEIKVIVTNEYLENIAKPLYLANLICHQFK